MKYIYPGEKHFEQSIVQNRLEQDLKKNSAEIREDLDTLEKDKINQESEEVIENKKRLHKKVAPDKRTVDFIEKHGEIKRREKKHAGKGIASSRPAKNSKQYLSKRDYMQRELEAHGISDPQEWREANNFDDIEGGFESIKMEFDKLFTYLDGEKRISAKEKIKEFSETEDCIERLELLRIMPISNAVECLRDNSDNPGQYRYLSRRLDFYQKLSQGRATRVAPKGEYYGGNYLKKDTEVPIDSSDVTPETIRLGVLRDMMYAGMIGTPELAVYKIANKRLQASGVSRTHMPEIRGYHSYINQDSIGRAYPLLHKLYEEALKNVKKRVGDNEMDEQDLEHKSVMLATRWLEDSMNYNDADRGPKSPYVSEAEESIAWARLGDNGVKAQLRGMRQKIRDIDLQNIKRFIGKCGPNKYDPERKKLYWQITNFDKLVTANDDVFIQPNLPEYAYKLQDLENAKEKGQITDEEFDTKKQELDKWFEENKTNFLIEENKNEVDKQNWWRERVLEKLQLKLDKELKEVEELNLPDEERQLQLESVKNKYEKKVSDIENDYHLHVEYFNKRDKKQLLADLQQRQKSVTERYEKRKNLAQKALDLHWMKGVAHDENDEDNIYNPVDWINYAPLGTIKRSHRMMRDGIAPEKIIKYALADIICGKRGMNREDLTQISKLYDSANAGDRNKKQSLESMMKVGSIISLCGHEASLDDIARMSRQNFYGMTSALREYNLDEVREFMGKNINLNSVVNVKKITEKFGHKLDNDVIAEMASHNIEGLSDALHSFDLDAVRKLLNQDVNLSVATAVLNNTKQFGYELSIDQIANIAKNVRSVEDFTAALRGLPLKEVEKLFTIGGISYRNFSKTKWVLERHKYKSDFNSTLNVSQKLSSHDEYDNLDQALDSYSLEEVDQITSSGTTLHNVMSVKNSLDEKGVTATLNETILFTKLSGNSWNIGGVVKNAIEAFGIDDVKKIASKSCGLDKAVEVHNYINGNKSSNNISDELKESLKKGGLDVVIAIAKAGNMEVAIKTIEAGFTIEEITRFPYLISSLVTK